MCENIGIRTSDPEIAVADRTWLMHSTDVLTSIGNLFEINFSPKDLRLSMHGTHYGQFNRSMPGFSCIGASLSQLLRTCGFGCQEKFT